MTSRGALLLEAYLDRRLPDWRDRDQEQATKEEPRAAGRWADERARKPMTCSGYRRTQPTTTFAPRIAS